MSAWPFGDIKPFSQDLVLADPPWAFKLHSEKGEVKSAQAQYDCMGLEDIGRLPVGNLVRPNAFCLMWTTWPFIEAAPGIMRQWGFKPVSGGAWFKRTVTGKPAFGTGYRFRSACEPFLLGTVGNPKNAHNVRNVLETFEDDNAIVAATRGHSRKPDAMYDLCEALMPEGLDMVELFARQRHVSAIGVNWSAWGNQADCFEANGARHNG